MARCKSCLSPVLWVKLLPRGKAAPLDATPSTTGNIRLFAEPKRVTKTLGRLAQVLSKNDLANARAHGEQLYTSHFATCPNSAQHRKPKEPATERVWIVYDGRAETMPTDECTIYVTCESEREARGYVRDDRNGFGDGVIFVYDLVNNVATNERRVR